MSSLIHLAEIRETKREINEKCIKMFHQALVHIMKLQIISEDYLPDDLPIGQLRQMETNISALLEQAEEWQE